MAKRIRLVPQMELADCGAACLAMVLGYHGQSVSLAEMRDATGTGRGGVDALQIVDAATQYGLIARGVRADLDSLHLLPAASILHWGFNHFVVFERLHRGAVQIVDPSSGRRQIPLAEFGKRYTGVAITVESGSHVVNTRAHAERPRRGTWRYVRSVLERSRLLRQVLVTSLLMRVFALALPLLTAVLVDRVLGSGDVQLLMIVSLAGLAMVAYFAVASWLRAHLLLELRTHLDAQLALGFVSHLVSLPYAFFLKRSAGDLMMRLRSNSTVREFLTTGALAGLLDGAMVCLYLVLLLAIDWRLGVLVLGLGSAQVVVLALSSKRTQQLMAESLEVEARSGGYIFEMLSGIETLKAAGIEQRGVEHWANLFAGEINASLARGRLSALVESLMAGLRLASPLAILAVGGAQVLAGQLSLGEMLALSALAGGFLEPLSTLLATGLQLQLLGSYMERINDVLDTPREQQGQQVRPATQLSGHIRAEGVSFRYSPAAPLVVTDVSLEIRPGQKVAIVGRSGSGKSTLAHLLLGLYAPEAGRVLYDDMDLAQMEVHSVRRQMGIVNQGAYLFGTSIRQNIALADPDLPLEAVEHAARQACIHDDISNMPLGYATPLSDGGASLSGGQRQRITLARALAQRPSILLLDEATSALDSITERLVYRNLADLGCTAIVIAHRLSTIVDADLILVMDNGRLVERGTHGELLARRGEYHDLVQTHATPAGVA
jgi:ABC-type bacteriocin/lantibiotic exporter with double-glycine peptidase domain